MRRYELMLILRPDVADDKAQAVIDEHALWNCKWTAIGGFFPVPHVVGEFVHRARWFLLPAMWPSSCTTARC